MRQPEGKIPWLFTDFEVMCKKFSNNACNKKSCKESKWPGDCGLCKPKKVHGDPRQGLIEYPKSQR